jgi:cell division transport system ATP-binding protein
MIIFRNVTKIFPPHTVALDRVSFEIEFGELVALVGRSGAGKTTILKLLTKEIEPTYGEIWYKNLNLNHLSKKKIPLLRKKITTIFQDFKLLLNKTVFQNVALPLEIAGWDKKRINDRVNYILERLNLMKYKDKLTKVLSGGEKQKVAIARALSLDPEVILCDEPTGNLDPITSKEILDVILEAKNDNKIIIIATHNPEVVSYLKPRVITLDYGRIVRDEYPGKFILT